MDPMISKLNAIILLLQDARNDALKVDKGKTGSPGTRLRKVAWEATSHLKSLRSDVLARRKGESE